MPVLTPALFSSDGIPMSSAAPRRALLDTEQAAAHLGRDVTFIRRLVQHR